MYKLWSDIVNNLQFVAVTAAIIALLAVCAKAVERFLPEMRKVSAARKVCIIGICSAIATVLHLLDFRYPLHILRYNPLLHWCNFRIFLFLCHVSS